MYQALRHFGRGVRLLEGHGALTKSATANLEGCTGVPRAGQLVFYNTSADKAKDEMKQQDKPDLGTTVQRGAAEQKAGAAEEAGYERARERGASVNEVRFLCIKPTLSMCTSFYLVVAFVTTQLFVCTFALYLLCFSQVGSVE
eukprot:jgi/Mesen1/10398/ME000081S09783